MNRPVTSERFENGTVGILNFDGWMSEEGTRKYY